MTNRRIGSHISCKSSYASQQWNNKYQIHCIYSFDLVFDSVRVCLFLFEAHVACVTVADAFVCSFDSLFFSFVSAYFAKSSFITNYQRHFVLRVRVFSNATTFGEMICFQFEIEIIYEWAKKCTSDSSDKTIPFRFHIAL